MENGKPSAALFFSLHVLGLIIAVPLAAQMLSNMDRGAFISEPYSFIVQILLIALILVKGPALIVQYVFYRSALWQFLDRISRCIILYILDLFLSVLMGILTFPLWIPLFFTSAGYPLYFALAPQALLVALLLTTLTAAPRRVWKKSDREFFLLRLLPPEKTRLITHGILVILSLFSSVLATMQAQMQSLNFIGLLLSLFPLFIPFILDLSLAKLPGAEKKFRLQLEYSACQPAVGLDCLYLAAMSDLGLAGQQAGKHA